MRIKKFFLDRPVRTKISGAILIVLLGISVFNLLFFPAQQKKLALERMKAKAESMTLMLAHNLSPALDLDDRQLIGEMVKGAFKDKELSSVRILRFQHNDTLSFQTQEPPRCTNHLTLGEADTTVKVTAIFQYV